MPTIGETLTDRIGPLPGWAWGLIGIGGAGGYFYYRRKKQAAAQQQAAQQAATTSSNLGTVPVSNLTQQAQPMPIQLGDTFVNVGNPKGVNTQSTGNPSTTVLANPGVTPADNLQTPSVPAAPPAPVEPVPASAGQVPGTG